MPFRQDLEMSAPTLEHSARHIHDQPAPLSTVTADSARAWIRLCGEIDAALAPALSDLVDEHVAADRRYLRLEMSAVTFMDTTVLGVILAAHHRLLRSRGTLILTGVRKPVSRLLALTQLDQQLFVSGPRSDLDAATTSS
jgi:anti-sigma B factor antagonist